MTALPSGTRTSGGSFKHYVIAQSPPIQPTAIDLAIVSKPQQKTCLQSPLINANSAQPDRLSEPSW